MPTPKKNVAYELDVSLVDSAASGSFKVNPTIAAGDFQVSTDNGAFANLATLPVVSPAGSILVKVNLSAAEMNGDKVSVKGIDAAGAEWDDVLVFLDLDSSNLDDVATPAQVNTEVSDVMKTDTVALPGQAAPPSAPTMQGILGWLYKNLRNKKTQSATTWSLFDDAGTVVDAKATVSDAAATATKEEIVAGP